MSDKKPVVTQAIDGLSNGASWITRRVVATAVTLGGAGAAAWGLSHVDLTPLPSEAAWVIPAAIGAGVVNAIVNKGPTLVDRARLFVTGLAASGALFASAYAGQQLVPAVDRGQTSVDQLQERVESLGGPVN